MDNQILQTFYNRMMPLYTPQAEKFLDKAQVSKFSEISFRYTFSVEAMIKISRIIENTAISNSGVADVHVSFQHMSRLLPQREQYRKVSKAAKGLWLYGELDTSEQDLSFLTKATLVDTADSLLTHYWFVVAYGPGVGMALLAEEVSALDGEDRYYEGFYTFEQDVAYQIIAILHQIYPHQVPVPKAPELLGN